MLWNEKGNIPYSGSDLFGKTVGKFCSKNPIYDDLWGSIVAEDSGVQKSGEIREVQEDDSCASAFSSASHKGEEKYRRIIVSARMTPEHVYTLLGMVISLLILWSQFCSTLFWKTTVRTFVQISFELGNG